MSVQTRQITPDEKGLRLDRWFHRHYPGLSHGALQKLLRTGQVRLDGKRVDGKDRVEAGQTVRLPPGVMVAPAVKSKAAVVRSERDDKEIQRLVLYKDDHVIAINKPPGIAVQGGTGTSKHIDGMLDGLRFGSEDRPRLVHRLDKDTSGLMLIARNGQAAKKLTEAFRERTTEKLYWAVVQGGPPRPQGRIDMPLIKRMSGHERELVQVDEEEGQRAITDFKVLDNAGKLACLLALWPRTGRTHQLRVHCREIGCPILGDGKYGAEIKHGGETVTLGNIADGDKLHLHARRLRIPHPVKGELVLEAPPPPHFRRTIEAFGFSTDDV
jgi:23S rRNA pseudouridine955/2504/2580 synthase